MVAISIDRYLAIVHPLRLRMTKLQSKIIIAVIWTAAIVTSLPLAIYSRLFPNSDHENKFLCNPELEWKWRKQYFKALSFLQFILPFLLFASTYTIIVIIVWRRRTPGEAENTRDEKLVRSKRKVSEMRMRKNIESH